MAITFNQPSTDIIQSGDNIGLLKKVFAETPTTTQPVENYNIPKSFDASTLNNITTPVVPQTLTPPATDAFVKSLEASNKQIQDLVASYNQPTDQLAGEQTGLFAKLQETIAKQGTQGTRLTEEQAKLQVPENITKLQDINTQITQKMNEYNARVAALPGQGRGITTGIIQGQTDREKRLAATEIGALSSIAQTLQGNIALAQQTAKDTVDAEFAPYETEIKQLQTLIEANKDRMTTAEKRRAEQVQITLDERARLLSEQKAERNNVLALTQQAAQNGAGQDVLVSMSKASTPEEAVGIAGGFIGERKTEVVTIGGQKKLINSNTGEVIRTLGGSEAISSSGSLLDTNIKTGSLGNLNLAASNIAGIVATTGPAAKLFKERFNLALSQGEDRAWAFLQSQYSNKVLSGTEQENYNNVKDGIDYYDQAIQYLEENPDLQTGFYKATAEGLKPKFFSNKDPKYATLLNLINQAETPIRKKNYGTAISGNEEKNALRSLLNTDDDRNTVLLKLKQGKVAMENGLNRNMAETFGINYEPKKITASGKVAPSLDSFIMNTEGINSVNIDSLNPFIRQI